MYVVRVENRVVQGDILEEIEYTLLEHVDNTLEATAITLPYAVVMSQDCDLEQDYKIRAIEEPISHEQYIPSILLCPAFIAAEVKAGTHLEGIGLQMQARGKDLWGPITQNNNPRFHFLPEQPKIGLPELVVDFKRYYTLSRSDLYEVHKRQYKISIADLYREAMAQRFAYYLSRVPLPETAKV